jgi:hypothetical protein
MVKTGSWITLNSIIYDYISEAELSKHKYFKLFHIAFRVMEQLGISFFYEIKTVNIPINANKTATLPADFIFYNKAGIFNGVGELVPLKYNENLTTYNDLHPSRLSDISSDNFVNYYSYSSPVFFNYWNGDSYGNLYGVPVNDIYGGSFKIDGQNGVVLLDPNFAWDSLVLEYTASPQEGQEYYVPMQFREAIIAWLAWKDIINLPRTRRGDVSMVRDRRHEYFEARRLAIRDFRPFNLDQAYQQSVDNQRLVVKI